MADEKPTVVKNAKVRVLALSFINNQLLEAGTEIEGYTGEVGSNLELVTPPKKAAKADPGTDDGSQPAA